MYPPDIPILPLLIWKTFSQIFQLHSPNFFSSTSEHRWIFLSAHRYIGFTIILSFILSSGTIIKIVFLSFLFLVTELALIQILSFFVFSPFWGPPRVIMLKPHTDFSCVKFFWNDQIRSRFEFLLQGLNPSLFSLLLHFLYSEWWLLYFFQIFRLSQ